MVATLVDTKFFVPHARAGQVPRPRLVEMLGAGRPRLVLVSAPAGFGKTTMVASWVAQRQAAGVRVAWVSLDEADREPGVFWAYVLTALDRAAPGTGAAGLPALEAGQPVETALGAVLNELSVMADDLDVVLDDYHLAETPAIQPGVAFLIERLPPQVRLLISTRVDPALPLARMRARGELTELRTADLRFTEEEAAAFLADNAEVSLGADQVAALGARTEGWAASLQLAALSLRGRADPAPFVAGFAGDDRYVVDYLVEEVLDREPAPVRRFLLETAVLDRMCGPLCDAVTGGDDGAAVLESLDRRNLFVVPLDATRRWYRYHQLFADVLRAHLRQERPGDLPALHRRAADWLAAEGEAEGAVRHALAAGDGDAAADIVERALPRLRRERRESLIGRWADELPADVVRERPVLAVGLIGGMMASHAFASVEERLPAVEEALRRPAAELRSTDPAELARVPAAIEVYRSGLALVGGDLEATAEHARRAADTAVEGDDLTTSAAAGLAGLAAWTAGDIEGAIGAYRACAAGLTRIGHIADVLGCSLTLADMHLALGRLGEATAVLEDALALAERNRPDSGVTRGTADMLVGLSRAAWHRDDLATAADLLRRAEVLGEAAGLPQHPYRWRVALARLRVAAADFGEALQLLDEAERVYVSDFSPPIHPVHATRARVLVASGDLAGALAWARHHRVAADDALSYVHEYEHLTLARVLLAEHTATGSPEPLRASAELLDRIATAAGSGGRGGTLIEVELLRARAARAGGDDDAALAAVARAVAHAAPGGWVRAFVDAGPAVAELLARLASSRPELAHAGVLAAAIDAHRASPAGPDRTAAQETAATSGPDADDALVDPLSERELEVLRLLGSDLDGPAIARELYVSLNTVRTHTKHIYTKLGVNSRRAAITRAHRLGLLSGR